MKQKEIDQLVRLLRKLKEQRQPGKRLPFPVWAELAWLVTLPAVEVIISQTGKDFLLTKRNDHRWHGWHLPGGFMIAGESLEETCQRIGRWELKIEVSLKKFIDIFVWPDHPYAQVVSLICLCQSPQKPKAGRFFTRIPSRLFPHHEEFIKKFLKSK
ncbi:MAG: NUDIX hydrolase [Candidatus Pacebacteria bacterium]|nr:NUDIX hydrolase [Candidatus Paceibacterota bacterium]